MADTTRTTSGSPYSGTSSAVPSGDRPGEQGHGGDGPGHPITEAKKVGSELVGAVRDSAVSMLDTQRSRAADQIAAIGEAVRRSAQSLDSTGGETIVRYADQAARQISDFAETLRTRSWGDLTGDVEDFARRYPMAFMASAIGIGFIAGRFWMSSAEQPAGHVSNAPTMRTGVEMQPGMARHDIGTPVAGGTKPGYGATSTGE